MNWKRKVKNGYLYKLDSGALTGQQGALNYGKQLEEDGFENEQIERCISRSESTTTNIHSKYIKLTDINE